MTFRQYILSMIAGTIMGFLGWAIVITSTDPLSAGITGFLFFYLSAYISLAGTLAILGLLARVYILRQKVLVSRQVATSARQAFLLSAVLTGALILQGVKILNWWNIFFLVGGITMIEFFLISLKRRK